MEITRFLQIKENLKAILDPGNKAIIEDKHMINLVELEKEKLKISSKFFNEIENSCNLLERNYDSLDYVKLVNWEQETQEN